MKEHRIDHHQSCPHAHQQMGDVERKHKHIVDSGLAILNHAQLSQEFWNYAFAITTFSTIE